MKIEFKNIENIGINSAKNEFERDKTKIVNHLLILLSAKFFFDLVFNLFFVINIFFFINLIIVSFFIFSLFRSSAYKINIINISIVYYLLILLIFFFSAYIELFLYYFVIVLTIPLLYDLKKDRLNIILMFFVMIIGLVINLYTNFSIYTLFSASPIKGYIHFYRISSIIQSMVYFLVVIWYAFNNTTFLRSMYRRQKFSQIFDQSESIDTTQNLYQLIKSKDPSFYVEFKKSNAQFIEKLLEINSNLIPAELEICAMCKLNLSTKEIAIATNSSIRSVQGKKHRIRKKLNIESNQEISIWMNHDIMQL